MKFCRTIDIRGRSASSTQGRAAIGSTVVRCAMGRSGKRARKREGDGATPVGTWRFIGVFYRADRVPRPRTILPVRALSPDDGWCDAVGDRNYNRRVRHPYAASAERMWRSDRLYDLVIVITHNRHPRVQGAGSAVFLHLCRPGYQPTEGCIALNQHDLRRMLSAIGPDTRLRIGH